MHVAFRRWANLTSFGIVDMLGFLVNHGEAYDQYAMPRMTREGPLWLWKGLSRDLDRLQQQQRQQQAAAAQLRRRKHLSSAAAVQRDRVGIAGMSVASSNHGAKAGCFKSLHQVLWMTYCNLL